MSKCKQIYKSERAGQPVNLPVTQGARMNAELHDRAIKQAGNRSDAICANSGVGSRMTAVGASLDWKGLSTRNPSGLMA